VASARAYADPCGIARALDVVGERWALLIVRELLHGPKRFTDLRAGLGKLSADVLSQRLRELEAAGVVARGELPPPAASKVYELTPRGRALEPVLHALGRWGSVQPLPAERPPLGIDAFVTALETLYAGGLEGAYGVAVDGQPFGFSDGVASRGAPAEPVATLAGDTATLAAALWHGGPPPAVDGSRAAARRFLRAFPLPEPQR
jgi:DNA-binding HxlR family transcriptional regulator